MKRQDRQELTLKEAVFRAPSLQQACANIAQLENDKVLEILSERGVINFTNEGNKKQMIDHIEEELKLVGWNTVDISNTCTDTEYKGKMTYASRLQKRINLKNEDAYIVVRWESEEIKKCYTFCICSGETCFNYDVRVFLVRFRRRRKH